MSNPEMPLSSRRGKEATAAAIVHANAPQSESGRRPYLLKMLQHHIGSYILADTLDWDALTHFKFDATMLSLDDVYEGLRHDRETYYFLWVAVRKVLEEAPDINKFSGARVGADQKTQFVDGLLDAALEQLLVELGDALMNLVEGPHCTSVDPRNEGDPHALRAKARSLVARFEKLGRSRDTLMVGIPATEAGIDAAATLQREDGINVNLTFVSGVLHAAACAQAGAVAVTLSIEKTREWRRTIGQDIVESEEESTRAAGVEGIAQTIAAYFELHGFSSTTGLIASEMDHVDDACPLATMAALSFDAEQANKAEWYTSYPKVRLNALPKQAVQRAGALPKPPPPRRPGTGALKHLDAWEFSAFAGVTCGAVGSGRAAMSMIADIARQEIEWQLRVMQPSSVLHIGIDIDIDANSAADSSAQRRSSRRKSGSRVSTRALSSGLLVAAAEDEDGAGVPAAHGQRGGHMAGKKRKRSTTSVDVAETPDSPCSPSPPEKRVKRGSAAQHSQQLYHRDRGAGAATTTAAASSGSSGTRGAINVRPLQRPLTRTPPPPPAGPAAAFLYSLGMRQGTMDITLERGRRMRGAGRRR